MPLSAGGTELTIPAPNYAPDSGFSTINSPGNPSLPAKDLYILLPPDTDISSVSAHLVPGFSINRHTNQDIEPFPPAAANVNGNKTYDWGPGKLISNGRNLKVYSKNDFYPQTNVELIQVGKLRQYIIAHIRYYPLRYNPVSKELLAVSSAKIQIKYAQSKSYSTLNKYNSSSEKLRSLVINYNDASNGMRVQRHQELQFSHRPNQIHQHTQLSLLLI